MKKITLFVVAVLVLAACSDKKSKLDELLEKKKSLRNKLAQVQEEINGLMKGKGGIAEQLVKLDVVKEKTFIHKIKVQGNVETDQDVLLNAELGGLVTQVLVKEGQRVSAGQTLVVLDAAMISSSISELQTQLEYAEYMLTKQEELKKRGVGSEFDYKSAKNQVDGLKSKMKSLGTQKGKSYVKAPFSGVIDQVYAKTGQMAGPQGPLLRIVNNNEINISADLSEKHLQNVKVGTEVKVNFPNFNDTTLNLKITQVGNYIDPTNRTFRVISNLKNNKALLPNMLASLEITDIVAPMSMVVPSKSILKSQENEDFVFIAEKKSGKYVAKKALITVFNKYNGEAQVTFIDADIKHGVKVVVDGARGIAEGDILKVK